MRCRDLYSILMQILSTAFLAAIASILTGFAAESLTQPVRIIGEFVTFRLLYNPDIAFGIVLPAHFKELLIAAAILGVLWYAFRTKHDAFSSLGFGLIIGGAVANLFDRLPDGIVTDFIAIGTFPIFNIADACITIGAGILLLESCVQKRRNDENSKTKKPNSNK